MLALLTFLKEHRAAVRPASPIERRTETFGIFPNEGAITRPICAGLLEQNDERAVQRAAT
ncbi:hypothetical protein SH611_16715 [Geminicoccaceae bacterium 1502E]|nr:hypothetical protein [Geminicoccaceae bacterium 1502E]